VAVDEHPDAHSLVYASGDQAVKLPEWCRFLVALGTSLGTLERDSRQAYVAISVPTSAFAAPMLATGVVVSRALAGSVDKETHFRRLRALRVGTSVSIELNGMRLVGHLAGTLELEAEVRLGVRLQNSRGGNLTRFFSTRECLSIRPLAAPVLDLPEKQRGQRVGGGHAFLESWLGPSVEAELLGRAQLDCVIVGPKSRLLEEIQEHRFGVAAGSGGPAWGTLAEVLRLGQLLPPSENRRCELVSADRRHDGVEIEDTPHVCLLDGAKSILRDRQRWPGSHRLMIVDRSEPSTAQAVAALLEELQLLDWAEPMAALLPSPPPSVEVLAVLVATA
jgi:hypothetical protein